MTSPHGLPGRFIVFDGGEGCGKSTQAKLLLEHFRQAGRDVLLVRDPGTTAIGEQIRGVLLDPANDAMHLRCEMLLYMAARAQLVAEIIKPALQAGRIVLSDRFVSSTLAYQLAGDELRQGNAGLSAGEILMVAEAAVAGCWPDLTVLLDMPIDASQRRVKPKFVPLFEGAVDPSKDRIEQRPLNYHRRVRENFLALANETPGRYAVINGNREREAVFTDVLKAVEPRLLR